MSQYLEFLWYDANYSNFQATQEESDVEKAVRRSCGVKVIQTFWGHTLYHRDDLPFPVSK